MARIPESELERLKSEVSLVRLVQSQGHTLTRRGRDFVTEPLLLRSCYKWRQLVVWLGMRRPGRLKERRASRILLNEAR